MPLSFQTTGNCSFNQRKFTFGQPDTWAISLHRRAPLRDLVGDTDFDDAADCLTDPLADHDLGKRRRSGANGEVRLARRLAVDLLKPWSLMAVRVKLKAVEESQDVRQKALLLDYRVTNKPEVNCCKRRRLHLSFSPRE